MENLGIDSKLLIAQLVNFGLFFYIFKKFVAKPFTRYIELEKNKEIEREKALNAAVEEKDKLEAKAIKLQQEAKKEEANIIAEAKEAASQIKERIIEETNQEVEEIRQKTKKQLEEEKNNLYRNFEDKVLELSLIVVNKTFRDVLTDEAKKKITERLIKSSKDKFIVQ